MNLIQYLCIDTEKREKGLGKKVIKYIEDYANENNHDLIFGHIALNSKYGIKTFMMMQMLSCGC